MDDDAINIEDKTLEDSMVCPGCGSNNYIKRGSDRHGKARVQCSDCGRNYGLDIVVSDPIPEIIIHYGLADSMCPAAKRSASPIFSNVESEINCRQCLNKMALRDFDSLTKNKSFSITGKAIDLLARHAKEQNISQSALVNKLIIESLTE